MTSTPPPPDRQVPSDDRGTMPQPGWTPAPLSSEHSAGFSAPQAPSPSGPERLPSSQIGRYAPRRSLLPLLLAAVGIAVAVVVGYTALRPPVPPPTPSASHSRSASATPSPRDGVPFITENDDATGTWKITEYRWDATGLSAYITVRVESGDLTCFFSALPHDGQDSADGENGTLQPTFPATRIQAGTSAGGWVHFPLERSTTVIFLRTIDQPQISAIEVAG